MSHHLSCRHTTSEGDLLDIRVRGQHLTRLTLTLDDIEDSLGQATICEQEIHYFDTFLKLGLYYIDYVQNLPPKPVG